MECPDCRNGLVTLFTTVAKCDRCQGTGKLIDAEPIIALSGHPDGAMMAKEVLLRLLAKIELRGATIAHELLENEAVPMDARQVQGEHRLIVSDEWQQKLTELADGIADSLWNRIAHFTDWNHVCILPHPMSNNAGFARQGIAAMMACWFDRRYLPHKLTTNCGIYLFWT